MWIAHALGARTAVFAGIGVLTGAAAAGLTFLQLGAAEAPRIAGYCLGVLPLIGTECHTVDRAIYLFPGLVFGLVFAPLLAGCGRLGIGGAVAYALASFIANAVAVAVCVSMLHPVDDLLPFDSLVLDLAMAGILAGAAGAGLLDAVFARLDPASASWRPVLAGAGFGVLTSLVLIFDWPGVFLFYMIWQGGYALAVARSLPG